jgi:zinc protease
MTREYLRRISVVLWLLFVASSASAQVPLTPDQAVPVDPNLTIGKLENGLTYFIRENTQPENRADLWLVVNAGSVLEDSDQLGLAHLVEHMAFNGTEHFAKSELVDYLESIGMKFGPSINAFTSFDETVYQLHVPTDDADILASGFQILEDWAHGISFDPEEIDKERGVVMEEWRLGLGAGARLRDKQFPVIFSDSRYAERLPIGDPEILQNFEHPSLLRFYQDWYRPELMAVVAVGDFDAADVEALIRTHFSRIESAASPREREYFGVPGHATPLFAIATDPELTGSQVGVMYKQGVRPQGTVSDYRLGLVQSLFDAMLNTRLFEMTQTPDAPFIASIAGQGRFVRTSEIYQLLAAVKDGGVPAGLEAILTEAERVARFGFTQGELDRQKTDLLRGFEQSNAERENRDSRSYTSEYQRVYLQGESSPGIEWEYEAAKALLGTVGLAEVNQLARLNITDENRVVLVSAPEKEDVPVPTEAELEAVFESVAEAQVEAYVDEVSDAPLMEVTPTPGSIVSSEVIEEIGVTVMELSNGARVMLKPTDFKDDEIVMQAYSPGGSSLAPDSIYRSAAVADQLVAQGGLGEFSIVDLQKALTGIAAGVGPSISTLTEGLRGSASPQDVETWFQLINMQFTAPRKDGQAFEAFVQRATPALANRGASPRTHFSDTLGAVMSQNNVRREPATLEWLKALNLNTAYEFYEDRFSEAGDFTFIFVGAFEVEALKPLIETYLASLPTTGREESWVDEGIRPPDGVIRKIVKKGLEPQAQTQLIFTGDFEYTLENRVGMRSLGQALQLRLRERLREDLGGTYGVGARGEYQQFPYPGYTFSVSFGSDPERVVELVDVVFEEIQKMKDEGPSEEDLIKLREQSRRELETNLESNAWWASQLRSSDFEGLDPRRLVREDALDLVTVDLVRAAAARWLDENRYVQVSLVPENSTIF